MSSIAVYLCSFLRRVKRLTVSWTDKQVDMVTQGGKRTEGKERFVLFGAFTLWSMYIITMYTPTKLA